MESMGLLMVAIVVIGAVAMYMLDRYQKKQEISWTDAGKIGVGAGILTGGVLVATTTDAGTAVVDAVKSGAASASEMFVGKPSF
jgi:preprotein translocase subunit YajC